jgi:hypothetical protein
MREHARGKLLFSAFRENRVARDAEGPLFNSGELGNQIISQSRAPDRRIESEHSKGASASSRRN